MGLANQASHIQIRDVQCVFLDEFAAGLDDIAHQFDENILDVVAFGCSLTEMVRLNAFRTDDNATWASSKIIAPTLTAWHRYATPLSGIFMRGSLNESLRRDKFQSALCGRGCNARVEKVLRDALAKGQL